MQPLGEVWKHVLLLRDSLALWVSGTILKKYFLMYFVS